MLGGDSATERRRKNRDEFENGENVDAESMMAVTKRMTRIPRPMRVLIATPPLISLQYRKGSREGNAMARSTGGHLAGHQTAC